MVQHSIRELERLHFALGVPNAQIGVLAGKNNALTGKTVELGRVCAADSDKVLDTDFAIQDALE